jgi:hypothetical protein
LLLIETALALIVSPVHTPVLYLFNEEFTPLAAYSTEPSSDAAIFTQVEVGAASDVTEFTTASKAMFPLTFRVEPGADSATPPVPENTNLLSVVIPPDSVTPPILFDVVDAFEMLPPLSVTPSWIDHTVPLFSVP